MIRKDILILDDEEEICEMIEEFLRTNLGEELDLKIQIYNAGDSGFMSLCQHRFDLVITDYFMPGALGTDILRHTRSGKTPNTRTPFIVVTGMMRGEEKDKLLTEFPDVQLFHKPIDIDIVCDTAELQLRRSFEKPYKILLAEGEESVAELFRGVMHELGKEHPIDLDIYRNGEEVLENYGKGYDLFIIDTALERVPGLPCIKKIRAAGDYTEAFIFTGQIDLINQEPNIDRFDPVAIFKKPFDFESLKLRLKSRLKHATAIANKRKESLKKPA